MAVPTRSRRRIGTLTSGNYDFTFVAGLLNVTKATLIVTADDQTRIYGDANPTLTASYSGFKNGETLATSGVTGSPTLSTSATPTSPVVGSPYAITPTVGTLAAGNYTFSFADGELDVTKATLTVTADDQATCMAMPTRRSRPATPASRTVRHSGPAASRAPDALHVCHADESGHRQSLRDHGVGRHAGGSELQLQLRGRRAQTSPRPRSPSPPMTRRGILRRCQPAPHGQPHRLQER